MAMTGNACWRYVLPVTMYGESYDFPCGGFRDQLYCIFVDGRRDFSGVSEIDAESRLRHGGGNHSNA
jgi:hypothetical protein